MSSHVSSSNVAMYRLEQNYCYQVAFINKEKTFSLGAVAMYSERQQAPPIGPSKHNREEHPRVKNPG